MTPYKAKKKKCRRWYHNGMVTAAYIPVDHDVLMYTYACVYRKSSKKWNEYLIKLSHMFNSNTDLCIYLFEPEPLELHLIKFFIKDWQMRCMTFVETFSQPNAVMNRRIMFRYIRLDSLSRQINKIIRKLLSFRCNWPSSIALLATPSVICKNYNRENVMWTGLKVLAFAWVGRMV